VKVINRLYEYLDYKNVKPTAFEKDTGMSNGYLGKQLKRNADVGEGVIIKIIEKCPDLNPTWLLTGYGEMIKRKTTMETLSTMYDPYNQFETCSKCAEKNREIKALQAELIKAQEKIIKLLDK
jgi:hypothetical protein